MDGDVGEAALLLFLLPLPSLDCEFPMAGDSSVLPRSAAVQPTLTCPFQSLSLSVCV
jgi:hypothetical protein